MKQLSQRKLAKAVSEIEKLIVELILSRASYRPAHPVSSGAYKSSEIPLNSRFIIRELKPLLHTYGYENNSKSYCKVLHKLTYQEINSVIEEIFGEVINIKTMNQAELEKARKFFGV